MGGRIICTINIINIIPITLDKKKIIIYQKHTYMFNILLSFKVITIKKANSIK